MYASQSVRKKVLNYEVQSLFIEALKNRQGRLGCESERILLQKDRKWYALSSPEGRWAKDQKGKIQPFWSAVQHSKCVVQHSKSVELALGH